MFENKKTTGSGRSTITFTLDAEGLEPKALLLELLDVIELRLTSCLSDVATVRGALNKSVENAPKPGKIISLN